MTADKIKYLEKEIEMTKEFIVPLEEIGIKGSVISNSFLSLKADNLDELRKVTALYPPSGKLFTLGFAGSKSIPTLSPFSVHVSNYSHCEADSVTVKYQSEKINIWIKLPLEEFNISREAVDKTRIRNNRTEHYTEGYNYSVCMGKVQRYAGGSDDYGSRVSYAENETDADEFYNTFMEE